MNAPDDKPEDDKPETGKDAARQDVIAQADRAQRIASDPMASVFVSASAGSGKTKLLIDRLLRLMLPLELRDADGRTRLAEGTDPARILCLTYTKAAAAEMANRLQDRLGQWVGLSDERLGAELRRLDVPDTVQTRAQARGLFLRVLDLPGGLRIETIHAFCQSLLRRFPLEAAVDPHFTLMEETDGALALREALERELALVPERAEALAGVAGIEEVFSRIKQLSAQSGRAAPLLEQANLLPQRVARAYRQLLEVGQGSIAAMEESVCRPPAEEALRSGLQAALDALSTAGRQHAEPMLAWLAAPPRHREADVWFGLFLTKDGKIRKMDRIVRQEARAVAPDLVPALEAEAERVLSLKETLKAQRLLAFNEALLSLSAPVLARFRQDKTRRGMMDYNDLIQQTRGLLREPGAAWVLYKLDGGIDHLLLDEVQDTSALQWEIAGALTAEFFSGEGAHRPGERPRTVFAVGDFKQSIYGFQGAEPEQFHFWRREFQRRVTSAGLTWRHPALNVSFRSVAPVLALVDAVFAQPPAAHGLLEDAQEPHLLPHISARPGQGGRVELWPLVPAQEEETPGDVSPWRAPTANMNQRSAPQRLAEALAEWIGAQLGRAPQPGQPPLRAGDVLVLVPKRSAFLRSLIRALKSRHVPVASFVRTGLTQQVAVRDLMSLCAALLLPQDDLTLANVLTSPLGGVSDESLMALATADGTGFALGRGGQPLWSVLRARHAERPEWRRAWDMLAALYARVDYVTPYGLLSEILGPCGGRARLLARLGPEATEPVDEMLSAALRYETLHPPSLQGFLHWLEASEASSRREAESAIEAVRVMTVHNAKGLQARLVILPHTTADQELDRDFLWEEEDAMDLPLWVPNKEFSTNATAALAQNASERLRAEKNRLLYVALTRASDWLVVCGWENKTGQVSDTCWYRYCEAGFSHLSGTRRAPLGLGWEGEALVLEEEPVLPSPAFRPPEGPAPAPPELPSWLGGAPHWRAVPAPVEQALMRPLTPSRPDGAEFGPLPASRSPLELVAAPPDAAQGQQARFQAMQRGVLIHRLLQVVPSVKASQRRDFALSWLARSGRIADAEAAERLCAQVLAIIDHPELAPLFAPGSRAEQPISGISAGRIVLGKVDRLRVGDGVIWLCDYKTGSRAPRLAQHCPVAYRRQMAAYRDVLRQLHPGYETRCFLVWTEGPEIVPLSDALLNHSMS